MKSFFSSKEHKNILLFYLLTAGVNFWFISSNWIYFWTKYMTFGQLGWVDGIAFALALFLDIPTGAIADIFGRKVTIQFAMVIGFLGTVMIASAHSLAIIFIGWILTQIGYSFFSGSGEALAYDTLAEVKEEERYEGVISKSHAIELYITAAATFLGGSLYIINDRIPQYLWASGFLLGVFASWKLTEPKIEAVKFSPENYMKQLYFGAKQIWQPKLKRYIFFFFVLLGVYYMYSWGFLRPVMATDFGFYSIGQSIIYAALTIISAIMIMYVPLFRKKISDMMGLSILAILIGIGFLIAVFHVGYFGIFSLLIISLAGKLAYPWISVVVNREIYSEYRATTLSTISLLTKIPYVIIAVIAGKAIQNGQLHTFNFWVACIIFITVFLSTCLQIFSKKKPLSVVAVN